MRWMGRSLASLALVLALATGAFADWKTGDSVDVEWKGAWYGAKVLEVKDGKYKIHYDGYEASWDEWIGTSRMRAKAGATTAAKAWERGAKVDVEWKGSWYPASVLEVKDGKYKIHYTGYDASWDEWIGTARMRAPSGAAPWTKGDSLMVEWKNSWYPASILEVKDGKYKIHYDGYDASWDEWITPERMKKK